MTDSGPDQTATAQEAFDEELSVLEGKGTPYEARLAETPYKVLGIAGDHPTNRIYGVEPEEGPRDRLGHNRKGRFGNIQTCKNCGRRFWDELYQCPICDTQNP